MDLCCHPQSLPRELVNCEIIFSPFERTLVTAGHVPPKIREVFHPPLGIDLFTFTCDQPQPEYFFEEGRERALGTRFDVRFLGNG